MCHQTETSLCLATHTSWCAVSRDTVLRLTLKVRAMSARVSPSTSRRRIASRFWCRVSFGLRPSLTPRAFVLSLPSPVRARIRSRSNSAEAAEDSQHQAAMRCGGVGPRIAERPETGFLLRDGREGVEEIARRAGEPIEPDHEEHVVGLKLGH
jgi:hypothetical protein